MRKDTSKEDYLRGVDICLLRVPNGWVLEDPEGFVRKVRERVGAVMDRAGPAEQVPPHPGSLRLPPSPQEGVKKSAEPTVAALSERRND